MFRFVNNNDVVTRVPTRKTGFRHAGQILMFDAFVNLQTDLHFWNQFLDRVVGRVADFGKPGSDGVMDHSMVHYVEHLGRKENRKNLLKIQLVPFLSPNLWRSQGV
jgi:hypothetical protein